MTKDKEKKIKINGVEISINIDEKTGLMKFKVDGPNKEVEKGVGEALLNLIKTTANVLGEKKVKVIKKGYTK